MAIVGSKEIYKNISSQIESQFPGFIREEGPQFVAFLKAYFEYMEQNGKAGSASRSIQDNQDVDRTIDEFVEYFRREFMISIPKGVLADKRLLVKHIRDFYRTRGSQESYRFLFRALFGKEIDFYYPGDDILRASDGRWVRESKVRVASPLNTDPANFGGKKITGQTSGATAIVRAVSSTIASGITVYDLEIENNTGSFVDGERIVDELNRFATVNADVGALDDIKITNGGAFHRNGDVLEIAGASSTETARAVVTKTNDRSAVTLKLIKGGSGYRPATTKLIISGGDGIGFKAKIGSYDLVSIDTAINTDTIDALKNVKLNANSFFVRGGANTATVGTKLTGTVKLFTTTNTVFGQGTDFTNQLSVGDIVRVTGQANTLRVHSITSAQTFVTAIRPTSNQLTGANAYIRLAAANVSSVIGKHLSFSNTSSFSINAITIIDPGRGYTTLPSISIIDDDVATLGIDDGHGGILGENAVVTSNSAYGAISALRITSEGANFNKNELATITNLTLGNNAVVNSNEGQDVTGRANALVLTQAGENIIMENGDFLIEESAILKYLRTKTTFSGEGTPVTFGQRTLPGRYVDTKGFLSWNNKLQDNYYYQEFSYVIRVSEIVDKYRSVIKQVLHPAGTKMFGDYRMESVVSTGSVTVSSFTNILALYIQEAVTATDSVVGNNITSGIVNESISSADSQDGIVTKNVGHTETFTATDSTDAITTAVGAISEAITVTDTTTAVANSVASTIESVSATDSSDATASMVAALLEASGVIEPYANTVVSVYGSTTIQDFLATVLNLDDSVNATIT